MDSQELKRILREEVESRKRRLVGKNLKEEEGSGNIDEEVEQPRPEKVENVAISQKTDEIYKLSEIESNEKTIEASEGARDVYPPNDEIKEEVIVDDISEIETFSLNTNQQVLRLLKILFQKWKEESLNGNDPLLRKIIQNSDKDIEPLFSMLAVPEVPPVIELVREIAKWIKDRDYIRANDVYLKLAIGNNPWPIGI